jgi:hypothetical protein
VGQQRPAVDVTDRVQPVSVDARDAEMIVDLQARPGLEADGLETEVIGDRSAPRRDQQLVADDGSAVREVHHHGTLGVAFDTGRGDGRVDGDAIGLQRLLQLLAGERLLGRQQAVGHLDDSHLGRAESTVCLCHLDADGPTAEDDEAVWHVIGTRGVAVVPRADVSQAVQRGRRGPRAGRERDGAIGLEHAARAIARRNLYPSGTDQSSRAADDVGADALDPRDLVLVVPVAGERIT